MDALVRETMRMPPIARIGAYSTMRKSTTMTIWICWISLVPRVISDAAENFETSASLNSSTFANRRRRRFRAISAAVREARYPTPIATAVINAATASMRTPTFAR